MLPREVWCAAFAKWVLNVDARVDIDCKAGCHSLNLPFHALGLH